MTWAKAVVVEPLDCILNAILVEGDQVTGHLLGDWEVELRSPHDDVEGFIVEPFPRDIWGSNCSHLPVVYSLEEG